MPTYNEASQCAGILQRFCDEALNAIVNALPGFENNRELYVALLTMYVRYATLKQALENVTNAPNEAIQCIEDLIL